MAFVNFESLSMSPRAYRWNSGSYAGTETAPFAEVARTGLFIKERTFDEYSHRA